MMHHEPNSDTGLLFQVKPRQPVEAPLFRPGQMRLAELSVFNWGAFNELHTVRIDPLGTLITGDNGSGKTTLIDGLMALLLPAGRAAFNVAAAQGDKTDRSLLSYMRGSYGSAHDGSGTRVKSMRETAVVTGLRALYRSDDGVLVTLAALFWTTQSTNALSDVKRMYVVCRRNMALKEILDNFGQGGARTLKQWLKSDPDAICCDDNFSEYQAHYQKLLSMDNKNAPALLSRALGLKKIDDLTRLIRELVLEPSSVKTDARKVVDEFGDLVAIHERLSDARAQASLLEPLPELDKTIKDACVTFDHLTEEKQGLPIYLGHIFLRLWQQQLLEIKELLHTLSLQITRVEDQKKEAATRAQRWREKYLQLGGDKIENIKTELKHAREDLDRVVQAAARYQADAGKLNLSRTLEEKQFIENQSKAESAMAQIKTRTGEAMEQLGTVSGKRDRHREEHLLLAEEIREMETRPDSNIPVKFQQMRDELAQSLDLDRQQLMFIGELIDIKDEERDWQGAVERALGGLRTTLAVPRDISSMVTRWLNSRHSGLHVRIQVVKPQETGTAQEPAAFKSDGYLKKLVWRTHPYREWLKKHLEKFDLSCVVDTVALDQTFFSMTRQGLVQLNPGRFEKKDQYKIDDRRQWCMGFSNKARLAVLKSDKQTLFLELNRMENELERIKNEMEQVQAEKNMWEKLKNFAWHDIDAPSRQLKCQGLEQELEDLTRAGSDLKQAEARQQEAQIQVEQFQGELDTLHGEKGGIQKELETAQNSHDTSRDAAEQPLDDSVKERLARRVGAVTMDDLKRKSAIRQQNEGKLENELERQRNKKGNAEKKAIGIMSAFRTNEKWQALTVDWGSDIKSLPDYLEHLSQLEKEGLPHLVDQFVLRLNKHATQSLANISAKLASERDEILERIETINEVLRRTEFMAGSYLRLGAAREKYPHVIDFENQLRQVLSQVTSNDHEVRYLKLAQVVGILDKASAPGTSGNLESQRLLDPRYQMSFYAEEIDATTREVRDVLRSSSGKSGGEKESFAGTIVAASLAYVLTPDGQDRPVYCTVFLDEAFSNTAEAVSRRVLRVFRELDVHINLITPYKNLNLARESARSLIIVEKDPEHHDSRFCEVTWEEIDRMNEERAQQLAAEAEALSIELEPLGGEIP